MSDCEIGKGVWLQCIDADTPSEGVGFSPASVGLLATGNVYLCVWAGECKCCGEPSVALDGIMSPLNGNEIAFEEWRFKPLGGGRKLEAPKTGVKKRERA